MSWAIARRVVIALVTLLLATIVVFGAVHALPGGPATALSADSTSPAALAATMARYGFNQPLPVQYARWIGQVLSGQLGTSPITDIPVATQLEQRIPITLELGVLSLLFAIALGVPAGVAAAVRPGRLSDWVASTAALGGLSLPHFWFGILGILIFAVHLHVLPSGGFVPLSGGIGENLLHMVMPVIVLGTGLAAVIMRQTRAAMIEALGSDYVRTARAKGMREVQVIWIHALRNSLITVITVVGLQLGGLIAGVVTVEEVFNIPGIGQLTLDSVYQRDYPTLQGAVLLIAAGYIIVNLLTDLSYTLINPRLRVTVTGGTT
ncbi:MAG: peptide/nickel transport system permease protein [Trebonia sp.]|nr:peptide/nickel transport system permease protein [Trebonia sp.]